MKKKTLKRRDSRVLALSALFCWESTKEGDLETIFQNVARDFFDSLVPGDPPQSLEYAKRLFYETVNHVQEIDAMIARASQGWPLSRMPRVDLSVLRMAVAEILYVKEAPLEVVINEAVELCKEFSTHASPRFVNGVLMGIFREV
ncbi:MAG TPA: transcription antitermination factor NusB [Firmicutes bacterium]|nr:transcription antitermination factor NusB [Candidatus Fermentithermobacillaceae bacterium]